MTWTSQISSWLYELAWIVLTPIRMGVLYVRNFLNFRQHAYMPTLTLQGIFLLMQTFTKLVLSIGLTFCITLLVLYLLLLTWARIKHPVWSRLPAFHVYDLFRLWLWYPKGILSFSYTTPEHMYSSPYSKWYQEDYIRYRMISGDAITSDVSDLSGVSSSTTLLRDVCTFMRNHFSTRQSDEVYRPSITNLRAHLSHPDTRLCTVVDDPLPHTQNYRPIIGCVSFVPLRVRYRESTTGSPGSSRMKWNSLPTKMIDHLCIRTDSRKQGYFAKMCYTALVRQEKEYKRAMQTTPTTTNTTTTTQQPSRYNNVCLFRREGPGVDSWMSMGIIHGWTYKAYSTTFENMRTWFLNHSTQFPILPRSYRIQEANLSQLRAIFHRLQARTVCPKQLLFTLEFESLVALQKANHLWIHVLMDEHSHVPLAMYVWKWSEVWYRDNTRSNTSNTTNTIPSIECLSTVWLGESETHPLWYSGFRESLGVVSTRVQSLVQPHVSSATSATQSPQKPQNYRIWIHDVSDTTRMIREMHELHYTNGTNSTTGVFDFESPIAWSWLGLAIPPIPKESIVWIA